MMNLPEEGQKQARESSLRYRKHNPLRMTRSEAQRFIMELTHAFKAKCAGTQ